ncbi:hypothetical protein MHU86_6137 [Fragilaria crotonensis]|nr:hypothetical protein MHU86_6137 [Fragilaria crotonensis]
MGLPPRCDPECFSQLLSASCLTFLHQNWTDLPFAAFGIFSLYAFFQSSPLPVVQPSPPWQLFPMGLVHPDNPKLGYRRRFRQRIRIHRREYASIQRWRHVFLGYHNASSFNVHGAHYSWLNVLAGDVLEVLNRLEFEWSEYSGPRGVDALAAGMLDGWFKLDIPLEESMEEIVTNVGSSEERDLTRTTTDALKHYHAKLQAIELSSTSQHAKRVQVALKALAGKDYWQDQMNKLAGDSTHDLGLQEERGTVVVVPASEDHEFVSPACDAALPALCNIRLPPTVSESMQYHIRSAIQHLLQRGEKFLLPRPQARDDADVIQPISIAQTRLQEKLSRHDNFLMVQDDLQPQFDSDMSDVSDEEIHYALDDVGENNDSDDNGESAPGLGALKVLLSQARPSAKNSRRKRRTSLPEDTMSVAQSSVGRKALMSLLQQATKGGQVVQDIDSEAESLPSLKSKRNEASLTEYSAGRQALTSLLRQASERAHTSRSTRRHRAIKAHDIAGRKPQPKRTQAHSDEESDGSSSLGRNAMTTPPESVLDSQEPSIAASSVGHLALSSLLKQVNHEFDAKGMSASIRKLPTRGRRIQNERRTMPDGRRKKSDNDASTFGLPLGDSYNMPTGCIPGDEASSVAASSIGHLALSTLLKQVNDQSTTKRRSTTQRKLTVRSGRRLQGEGSKKLTRKLKMSGNEASAVGELLDIPTGPTREDEVSSVAASSIGHQALSSLLKQANNERNTNEMPTLRRRLPVRGGRSVSDDGNARPVRKRKKSGTEASTGGILLDDSYNMPTGCIPGDEASSVAASSIGHQALSSLLKQVKDHSTTKRKSTTQRKTSDRRGQAAPEEGNKKLSAKRKKAVNETSFAGRIQKDLSISRKGAVSGDKASSLADSSTGHQALPSLLKHADDESTAKQVSASLRQLPDRGGRRVPNKRLTEPTRKKSGNQSSNLRTLSDDSVNSRPGLIAGDEASSVAASSVGHLALSSLLKQVNDESRAKQPSTSPYKTPIRVRQGQQDDRNVNRAEKRRKSENGETSKDSTTTAVVLIDDDSVYSTSSVPRDDECSIAASSVGGQMLSSLLKQVNS